MIDFTQEIIENIDTELIESQEIEIETKEGLLIAIIDIEDTRSFSSPSYDSCDGLSELNTGDISITIDATLFDEDGDEKEIEFNINENLVYDYLNN